MNSKRRSFDKEWENKYMFVEFNEKPTCLVCNEIVFATNEFNIRCHYSTTHEDKFKHFTGVLRADKVASLKRKLLVQQNLFKKGTEETDDSVIASYVISQKIAKHWKPFTEGDFVKECMVATAEVICPEQKVKFENINLSANTVASRVSDLSDNIDSQLRVCLKSVLCWSAALNKSTDIGDTAQLAIFIRATLLDLSVLEELLDFVSLHDITKGDDIFTAFVSAVDVAELDWDKLVSCATDGAPSMVDENIGFVGLLKKKLKEENRLNCDSIIFYHCIIHQEALASKVVDIDHVMGVIFKCMNLIRSHGMSYTQFQQFLKDIDPPQADVVSYTDVRWLSRGAVLKRFWDLREQINDFMKSKKKTVPELEDPEWLSDLAFLVDVVSALNTLNAQLQSKDQLVTEMYSHVRAFITKLTLWKTQLLQGNLIHFKTCRDFFEKTSSTVIDWTAYAGKIDLLIRDFEKRFSFFDYRQRSLFVLFMFPFRCKPETAPEELQMDLIDMQASLYLQSKFNELPLSDFYRYIPDSLAEMKIFAAISLSMFGSTYQCEILFSVMLTEETKYRSLLTDKDLRAFLKVHCANAVMPNIAEIIKNK